jgi:AcrR family transcriptional regulator
MSLYNHVASKDELLALMVDHVFGTIPQVDPRLPWDDAVTDFFTDLHDALLLHPAAAQVTTLQPTSGEHTQRHSRAVIEILQTALAPGSAVEAFVACSCFTLGSVLYTAARPGEATEDPDWIDLGLQVDDQPALLAHLAARAGRAQFRSGLEHHVRGYATEATA